MIPPSETVSALGLLTTPTLSHRTELIRALALLFCAPIEQIEQRGVPPQLQQQQQQQAQAAVVSPRPQALQKVEDDGNFVGS